LNKCGGTGIAHYKRSSDQFKNYHTGALPFIYDKGIL